MKSSHQNTSAPGGDAGDPIAKWSKVTGRRKNNSPLYWICGGALAVMMVFAMSSQQGKPVKQKRQDILRADYQAALAANMAHLAALPDKNTSRAGQALARSNQIDAKTYLARQNAPTSMYQGGVLGGHATPARLSGTSGQGARDLMTTINAHQIQHPEASIVAGEFLHAVLETAINSDLPGPVRAIVSTPVYSYTGEQLMIPAGARLIGQYQSAQLQGQNRVMIIWNRIILPNGITVALDSPGVDSLGQVGQGADGIDTHFMARFGHSALLSVMGAGASTQGVSSQDQNNSQSQYRSAISQSFQQSARQSLQGTTAIKPTLHIHQGVKINVFVAHDLSFYQVLRHPYQTQSWGLSP